MSARVPLVLSAAGLPEALQPGDGLVRTPGVGSFGATATENISAGMPVYVGAPNGSTKARANDMTGGNVSGIAVADVAIGTNGVFVYSGPLSLTTGQWDALTGGTGGLVFGTTYFLDPDTSGHLVTPAPLLPTEVVMQLGVALSTTTLLVRLGQPTLL